MRLHCKAKDSNDLKDLFEGICEDLKLNLEETKKKCKVKVKVSLSSICQICEANDLFMQVDFSNDKISVYLKKAEEASEINEIPELDKSNPPSKGLKSFEEQTEKVVETEPEGEPKSEIPPGMEMDEDEDDLPF